MSLTPRRATAVVLVVLMATGCTKAVEVPRSDIDNAKYHEPGKYRVRLKNEHEYIARRFSVSDSTLVIEELGGDGELYGQGQPALPMRIPLSDVESIAQLKVDKGRILGTTIATAVLVALVAYMMRDTTTDAN